MQTNWNDEESKSARTWRRWLAQNRTRNHSPLMMTWQPNRNITNIHKQKLVSEGERWNDMSVYKAKQTTSAAIITFRKKKQKLYILYFSLNANLYSIENEGRTYENENIKLKQNALECNSLFFLIVCQID